jgi:hypothetical protein
VGYKYPELQQDNMAKAASACLGKIPSNSLIATEQDSFTNSGEEIVERYGYSCLKPVSSGSKEAKGSDIA